VQSCRPRRRRNLVLGLVLLFVAGLGAVALSYLGPSAVEQQIARYPAADVALLREQAEANGLSIPDEILLDTLEMREECRIVGSYLDWRSSGKDVEGTAAKSALLRLPAIAEERGQPYMADTYQGLVDDLQRGDVQPFAEFHRVNCADVE
jgi:hypothetical protein